MAFRFWRRRREGAKTAHRHPHDHSHGHEHPHRRGGHAGPPAEEAGISRTSQAVALTRARMERPHSPGGDPGAQARLCEGMRPTPGTRMRPMLTARTTFFDRCVLTALGAGVRQIVVCGAGYDDRALRFRAPGVRFFEVDQGPTQADKARRLQAMNTDLSGLTLATADFRRDDVGAVLAGCGHDAGQPTLFLCEGLLIYLDQPTITRFLAGLAAAAAAGSTLAASLAVHDDGVPTDTFVAAANARRRAARAEPWRTILPVRDELSLLRGAGWDAGRIVDAADLEETATPGRTLLISAVPARETAVRTGP